MKDELLEKFCRDCYTTTTHHRKKPSDKFKCLKCFPINIKVEEEQDSYNKIIKNLS